MAATTFAADTPLAVTGIIAERGLAGNWMWLSWVGVHAGGVVLFAALWGRAGVVTDAELLGRRYSGASARLVRGLRALLFGVVVNALTLAWVLAAMRKIAAPLLPWRELAPGALATLAGWLPVGAPAPEELLTVTLLLGGEVLDSVEYDGAEADGQSLLDHSVVLWCNELGKGNSHTKRDIPYVLAGGAGGALPTGRYLRYGEAPHGNLFVSILNAVGVPDTSFGDPDFCTGPLPGLLA